MSPGLFDEIAVKFTIALVRAGRANRISIRVLSMIANLNASDVSLIGVLIGADP